jgi:FkbM family methyltransferase
MVLKNIALNQLAHKVKVFNYGLGSTNTIAHFEINEINTGANKRVDIPTSETLNFEIKVLDDLFTNLGLTPKTKILVKIDIEGMEVEMIKGASKFLQYFENITLIIEEKLSGESSIRDALNEICQFEYGQVDSYNIYAKKVA